MPSPRFDADLSVQAAADGGATALYAVPTMVLKILESPLLPKLRPRLNGLRTGILAGSTIPVTLVRALGSELGLHGITIGFVQECLHGA
jgi:fatty-acyl-CoA synthase